MPVRLFHWSGQNHHIGRADGAVRLDRRAGAARRSQLGSSGSLPWRGGLGRGGTSQAHRHRHHPRILLWSHSHGGNVARPPHQPARRRRRPRAANSSTPPASFYRTSWLAPRRLPRLAARRTNCSPTPPTRCAASRSTWSPSARPSATAGKPPATPSCCTSSITARIRSSPTTSPPTRRELGTHACSAPTATSSSTSASPAPASRQSRSPGRTFLADWRLRRLLRARSRPCSWLTQHSLKHGVRVHHEGTTLLVDYADPDRSPLRHLFGHAPYTRSRWLPLHCELVARALLRRVAGQARPTWYNASHDRLPPSHDDRRQPRRGGAHRRGAGRAAAGRLRADRRARFDSVYRWQGAVEQADEWLCLIKTTARASWRDRGGDP